MRRNQRRQALAVAAVLLVWLGCASSSHVVSEGTSRTTVTVTRGIHFKAKGPITFPSSYPGIGGLSLAPGVEIDIELKAGESVTLLDKVTSEGEIVVTGVAQTAQDESRTGLSQHLLVAQPKPVGSVALTAAVQPGSTYTWLVPSMFGDSPAEVQVTGTVSVTTSAAGVVDNGNGTWTLDPAGLKSVQYQVSGPAAVWQAPIDTPYGVIQGSGSIESATGMVLEFDGDLSGVSGQGVSGYTDPDDGTFWDYGYSGAYPVKLSAGSGAASGASTVDGGFSLQ